MLPAAARQRPAQLALVQPLSATPVPRIASVAEAVAIAAPRLRTSEAISTQINPQTSAQISARIASTRRAQALSGADRWQRLPVAAGDTLDSLAERARGDQTAIPLSMVGMLLRWLNPRSFDGVGSQPLVGAELRFPKPESLAAQIAISGGVWTVDDVTASTAAAASAAVPPPSFQVLNPQSASDLAAAMAAPIGAGTALLAARPAAASALPPALTGGRAAAGGLAASSGLVGGAVLAGLLSMVLMLNMVVGSPAPQASRYVAAAVVARSESPSAAASTADARVLPAESVDLAALDLASVRQAEAVRQRTES